MPRCTASAAARTSHQLSLAGACAEAAASQRVELRAESGVLQLDGGSERREVCEVHSTALDRRRGRRRCECGSAAAAARRRRSLAVPVQPVHNLGRSDDSAAEARGERCDALCRGGARASRIVVEREAPRRLGVRRARCDELAFQSRRLVELRRPLRRVLLLPTSKQNNESIMSQLINKESSKQKNR